MTYSKRLQFAAPLLLLSVLLLAACGGEADTDADTEADAQPVDGSVEVSADAATQAEAETMAREAVAALRQTLGSELMKSMKAGGPVHAIEYCASQAQKVTAKLGSDRGIAIRRVSEKARNSLDEPDAYEAVVLADFQSMSDFGQLGTDSFHSEVVTVEGKPVLRYLKPLTIQQKCLLCHGSAEQIPAEIAAVLAERYPDDRATDYRDGELRGAVSVSVPLDGN